MNSIAGEPDPNVSTSVTVQIPRGSEAAFAVLVDAWCQGVAGAGSTATAEERVPQTAPQSLLTQATQWWKLLNANERAVWSLWIDAAPTLVPASRIVAELDLKNAGSIKGVINRMCRKGDSVGFPVGWQSDKTDPLTREKLYGVRDFGTGEYSYDRISMTSVDYAELIRNARAAAEH